MTKCPKCKSELDKPSRTWKYGIFTAHFYICSKCGTKFRDYTRNGEHRFTLMLKDGKYRKA